MKLVEVLWLAVFGLLAATLTGIDYAQHRGRLLGLWLLIGGWAVIGLLVSLGVFGLDTAVVTVALLSGASVLGTLFSLGRDKLQRVRVRR